MTNHRAKLQHHHDTQISTTTKGIARALHGYHHVRHALSHAQLLGYGSDLWRRAQTVSRSPLMYPHHHAAHTSNGTPVTVEAAARSNAVAAGTMACTRVGVTSPTTSEGSTCGVEKYADTVAGDTDAPNSADTWLTAWQPHTRTSDSRQ